MFYKLQFFLLLILLEPKNLAEANCDSINDAINNLKSLLKILEQIHMNATYPNFMHPIQKLLKKYENFNLKTTRKFNEWSKVNPLLELLEKKCENDKIKLDNLFEKLHNAKNHTNNVTNTNTSQIEVSKIEEKLENIYKIFVNIGTSNGNASKKCNAANKKFNNLIKDENNLWEEYKNVTHMYNKSKLRNNQINKDLATIFKAISNDKYNLDRLQISDEVTNNYIAKMDAKFNETIKYLIDNSEKLEELLKNLLLNRTQNLTAEINEVNKILKQLEHNVSEMKSSIENYKKQIPNDNFNKSTSNDTIKTIQDLEKKMELNKHELETIKKETLEQIEKFKSLTDVDGYFITIEAATNKLRKVEELIDIITSDENMNKAEKEIKLLEESILLYNEKKKLKDQVSLLKKYYKSIDKINCDEIRPIKPVET